MGRHRYKVYKSRLTTMLRLVEKAYYSNLLAEKKCNCKETWEMLNNVLHK